MVKQHLLLATRNRDKVAELKEMIGNGAIIHTPEEFTTEEVAETEDSLWGNALLKAKYAYKVSGLPSVADDTGLEVDALGGMPGVLSSRYAGINATYDDNVNKLLEEMKGVPVEQRTGRFRTVIAFVDRSGEYRFDGVVEGYILEHRRGGGGFGYDPVFLPIGCNRTFAQMDTGEKNRISHRGRAFRAFVLWWRERTLQQGEQ